MTLTDFQKELCTTSTWKFSDLRALFVNCTLKPSPELSHTEGLMRISMAIGQYAPIGRRVNVVLRPWDTLRWCHGVYKGTVQVWRRHGCDPGFTICALPGPILGRFQFTVAP